MILLPNVIHEGVPEMLFYILLFVFIFIVNTSPDLICDITFV
jgi:hypothetical protein